MGDSADLLFGDKIIEAMRTFVQHLMESGLSDKTLKRHLDNLWLLGGEIVHDIHYHNEYKTADPANIIKEAVEFEGVSYHDSLCSDADLKSFKSTCRKYHNYLIKKQK